MKHATFVPENNYMMRAKNISDILSNIKIEEKKLLMILSFIIGIITSLAAFVLKNALHYTHTLVTGNVDPDSFNLILLVLPAVGILLTVVFVKYIVKDNIGHGVSRILQGISKKRGRIKTHNTWTSIVGSIFTIGFGGSVGAEAPIVLTGSAIGSNLGKLFRIDHKSMIVLIGCGAAGAIAGIFKAPIAGIIFTLEVLMLDLTMASLIPLLISSVTAASLSYFLMGGSVLFSFPLQNAFDLTNIPYVLILGVVTGFVSLHFTRGVAMIEAKLANVKSWVYRVIIGGAALSVLIFFFPSLYGEGYDTIRALINGNEADLLKNTVFFDLRENTYVILIYFLAVITFKAFATSFTTGSGGVGGIFAPSLFMGGVTGYWLAKLFNLFGASVNSGNFVLIGMAGVMAGVMHAPLTALFLIAEITHGYSLVLPLMMTSVISYLTIMYFEEHSLYHKRLAQKGELITHHKDKTVLTLMKLHAVIEKDFDTVKPENSLGQLVRVISKSKRNTFPVVDDEGKLKGIVLLDDIRNLMFRPEKYNSFDVKTLMIKPPGTISLGESMEAVMAEFERTNAWNLPVLDNGKYIGFVSKSKIFNAYRKVLVHYSDE